MTTTYRIERDPHSGEYELICLPGYGIDNTHFFIGDTRREVLQVAKDIKPCDCADCKRQLSESIAL